jgi:hypothetical protein
MPEDPYGLIFHSLNVKNQPSFLIRGEIIYEPFEIPRKIFY